MRLLAAFILLLSLQIIFGKYDRTNDLFDFYASNPQGLRVFSFLKAVLSPISLPASLHIIYVGDCADIWSEDLLAWSTVLLSYQCLINDEDIDTCRYSLQADDRDLDFVRDSNCANAISQSQTVHVSPLSSSLGQSAVNMLLIPFHCGCHDVLHPLRISMQILNDSLRRLGLLPALIYAFNCNVTSTMSLLASSIEASWRSQNTLPHFSDVAASWLMLSGHCDWKAGGFNLLESEVSEHDHNFDNGGYIKPGYHNVLATVFEPQTLRHFSPGCISALAPKLSFVPANGSVIYCDVPFHSQFIWFYNSELQLHAKINSADSGILDFKSPYLTTVSAFLLQRSQEIPKLVLPCSDIVPTAPLVVPLEANFELFSTNDVDVDYGYNYKLVYALATPCSLPLDQIPSHLRAALHDAAIFTWHESNGSTIPPVLQVSAYQCKLL
jgi:hypothetical protein